MKFIGTLKLKLRKYDGLRNVYGNWLNFWWKFQYKINKKNLANKGFKKAFKRDINWDSPSNLIEKIIWMEFNEDTSLWTLCADKYLVRNYIKECGLEELLVPLYGCWKSVDQINFTSLPNSFILKANNGCGTVIKVKDKNEIDVRKLKKTLNKWLHTKYGYNNGQFHYLPIERLIIAEKLLIDTENAEKIKSSDSLIDYKIWCFNGVPEFVFVAYNRDPIKPLMIKLYTLDWKEIPQYIIPVANHYEYDEKHIIEKPKSLEKMIAASKVLSKPFKEVRVDFYEVDGKPYFGEMTFSTGFGYFTEEWYDKMGQKIKINK